MPCCFIWSALNSSERSGISSPVYLCGEPPRRMYALKRPKVAETNCVSTFKILELLQNPRTPLPEPSGAVMADCAARVIQSRAQEMSRADPGNVRSLADTFPRPAAPRTFDGGLKKAGCNLSRIMERIKCGLSITGLSEDFSSASLGKMHPLLAGMLPRNHFARAIRCFPIRHLIC